MLIRAHEINPSAPLPMTNLGSLYFMEGERLELEADNNTSAEEAYHQAVEALEEAVRLDPLAPRANFYLGTALYKISDYEQAQSVLLSVLALDSQMHEAHLTLINVYTRLQRYEAALEQIGMYLEANPTAPESGQLEMLRSQIEAALAQ